jgi:glyoxylase-like metal-dependent hydrolase (beta-lactamase superfamily II)
MLALDTSPPRGATMANCRPAPHQSIEVGDITVTFLPDGEGHFVPTGIFPASTDEVWARHEDLLDADGRYVVTIGAFLIDTGGRKIVVDLGAGPDVHIDIPGFATATAGKLLESLRKTGVDPADVDTVVYTHMHSDHAGWTTTGDSAVTFPNARHVIGASAEWDFWREHQDVPFAPPADTVLNPIEDRVEIASDGQSVAPGVTLLATPGHTPGHQTVVVSSGTDRAVILGDIMHCPLQLGEPEWSVLFDVDAALARQTRERLLGELEGADVAVGCGHFPEAAFGRVLRGSGKRYWQAI